MDPLTVSLILEKVFTQLSVEDMKRCRLVNKKWSYETTLVLRKSIASLPFGSTASLKNLISIASKSPKNPFTKFNLSSHIFSDEDCDSVISEFFTVFAPDLESLSITLDKDNKSSWVDLKSLHFPKLKQLTLTGHGLDQSKCTKEGSEVPKVLEVIIQACSKIENLSLMFDVDCRQTVRCLIDLMSTCQESFKCVQTLEIYIPVGDHVLSLLSKMPFRLRTLKCDFHRSCFLQETLKNFLHAQHQSLEYLKFDNYYGNSCYIVDFPVMINVKTLKIDGKSELSSKEVQFLPFSYKKQFPSLNKLILGGSIQFNKCWRMVFPDDTPVKSVKDLKLTAQFIDPASIERISTIFPNLCTLYFVLSPRNELMAETIFKFFPNLQNLTVYFHSTTANVDHIFTGLSREKCQMVRNNPEFLSLCSDEPEDKERTSLRNLTRLEEICLQGENPKSSHITDVTARITLMHMPSLKTVKMHPFHVSTETLKLLKEKFTFTHLV